MENKGILGKKIGMTQVFSDDGTLIPVTAIEVQPNVVMQIKSNKSDGYNAIQLGTGEKREVLANKPEEGHAKKANTKPQRFIHEIRDVNVDNYKVGDQLKSDVFKIGDKVDVTGTTKGHGYQGNVHKDNQSRGPETHGSRYHRRPGSLGSIINRVVKGMKLPGRMGNKQVTSQNLEVAQTDPEKNLILIKGNVPGSIKSFLVIQTSVNNTRKKNHKIKQKGNE